MTITTAILRRILTRRGLGSAAIVLAGIVGYAVHAARAGIPATKALVYAGTLMDGAGAPLTDQHSVEVGVYSALSGGSAVCPVVLNAALTPDATGGFKVELDDACAAEVAKSANLWLEVKVDGTPLARSKLGAVPYAIEAKHADTADDAADSALLEGKPASAFTYKNGTGLSLAGTTFSADTAYLQRRAAGMSTTCSAANLSIKTIAADGTVTCESDAVATPTEYMANSNNNPTLKTGVHQFCALTRVYQYNGGDVSNRACSVTKDASGGTWTLAADVVGGAVPAYVECNATCF